MTKLNRTLAPVVLVTMAVLLMGPIGSAQETEYCSQGEFARLLCEGGKIDPRTEWTDDSAIAKLGDELGIEPLDGWDKDATLTEGDMVFLVRHFDVPVFTAQPDREVTLVEARAMIGKFQRLLLEHVPSLLANDNQTATTIVNHGAPAPDISP